jgi:hypothetical protein
VLLTVRIAGWCCGISEKQRETWCHWTSTIPHSHPLLPTKVYYVFLYSNILKKIFRCTLFKMNVTFLKIYFIYFLFLKMELNWNFNEGSGQLQKWHVFIFVPLMMPWYFFFYVSVANKDIMRCLIPWGRIVQVLGALTMGHIVPGLILALTTIDVEHIRLKIISLKYDADCLVISVRWKLQLKR